MWNDHPMFAFEFLYENHDPENTFIVGRKDILGLLATVKFFGGDNHCYYLGKYESGSTVRCLDDILMAGYGILRYFGECSITDCGICGWYFMAATSFDVFDSTLTVQWSGIGHFW